MKLVIVFTALVAVCQAASFMRHSDLRIGGRDAKEGEVPYQIALSIRSKLWYNLHWCSGSILNEYYVLTAARCVLTFNDYDDIFVVAGTTDLKNGAWISKLAKAIIHPGVNRSGLMNQNDIALVRVSEPFVFSQTISPVALPEKDLKTPNGTLAVVSGWGFTEEFQPITKLQVTDVLITTQEFCNQTYAPFEMPILDSQVCTLDHEIRAYRGDSGSPLMVDGKIVGIASWGFKSISEKWPQVYTRVSEYIDWINDNAV